MMTTRKTNAAASPLGRADAMMTAMLPLPGAFGFGAGYWRGLGRIGEANASFLAHRIGRNAETLEEMARCRTLDEMVALQKRWLETTVTEYGDHAGRLMEAGAEQDADEASAVRPGQVSIQAVTPAA